MHLSDKEKKMKTVLRFLRDERGTETVEWAIVIGLIAVGAIVAITSIGGKVQTTFETLDGALP
jgi:pilus assembly protein Flp/PilA